jgi:hypothetical protein
MAKKPAKAKREPAQFDIYVVVKKDGSFHYTLEDGSEASTIRPFNNDTVRWTVKVRGCKEAFTIEFPDFSPFGVHNKVFRSFGGFTAPATVNVSPFFRGNLAMKYNVTLTNGWSDDPDIVPIPSDGLAEDREIVNPPILLSIGEGGLVISPPRMEMVAGVVIWQWDDGVPESNRDDFDLEFNPRTPADLPAGWPGSASTNGTQEIYLNLPKGGNTPYTITTENMGLSARSSLTVLAAARARK